MQPYQKAEEAMRTSGEYPINLAKNIGLSAAGGAVAKAGSSAIGALLPKIKALISDYVPEDLAMKGLGKIDPRFNKFIKGAQEDGFDFGEIRSFIGEQVDRSEQKQPQQKRNIIEQYSPELHQFLDNEIKKGRSPIEAGALAELQGPFKKVIKKLTEDHKAPFSALLDTVYGSAQQPQSKAALQEQPQQQQAQQGIDPNLMNIMNDIRSKMQNLKGR